MTCPRCSDLLIREADGSGFCVAHGLVNMPSVAGVPRNEWLAERRADRQINQVIEEAKAR